MLINFDSKDKNNKIIKSEMELLGKDCKNIKNENDAIEKAIKLACKDFMARTETANEKKGLTLFELLVSQNSEYNSLVIILKEFFSMQHNSQNAFDNWHYETCTWILARIRQKYPHAAYGKAQKILNMTFKYLYCTQYGQNRTDHFKYCHMALDSYILEWVFRDVYTWYNEDKKHQNKLYNSKTPSWSKLNAPEQFQSSSELDNQGKYYYTTIIKRIFEYFENKSISPFEAEFIIWREIQLHIAAENFIFAFTPTLSTTERKKLKEKTLEDKLKEVKTYSHANEFANNQVSIVGKIVSEFSYSHEIFGEAFYIVDIKCQRQSEIFDIIPVMLSERLLNVTDNHIGKLICINGHLRTRKPHKQNNKHFVSVVLAKNVAFIEEPKES